MNPENITMIVDSNQKQVTVIPLFTKKKKQSYLKMGDQAISTLSNKYLDKGWVKIEKIMRYIRKNYQVEDDDQKLRKYLLKYLLESEYINSMTYFPKHPEWKGPGHVFNSHWKRSVKFKKGSVKIKMSNII